MTGLVDQYGQPLRRELLTRDVGGPTLAGVRSPIAGYPADGMNPARLAELLRAADQGEPLEYFELAEIIEERDLHYAGVLATRKRSVSQIDITVEAASDDAEDVRRADMVRDWLKRDELADETFDMLDAIGKGVSFTEIIWDSSEGQWRPDRLEWRDPRWFTFDRQTLRKPMLRGGIEGYAVAEPLPAFKFIYTQIKAKSGLPIRSGIARLAVWSWMFKAFTQRDWAIFIQTYGQPVRVGKFHEGATKEDKATLFRAVANIAGDCAAIIPASMEIEFIEAKNATAGSDLYERRADWLDRQVSKAVVGQTGTTDTKSGGLGDGGNQVHAEVREDIETADCKALSAVINRDLIRPWMDLEFGPSRRYPRVVIARPKPEDLKQLTDSLRVLVPLGFRVEQSEIRDKFGLSEPAADAEVFRQEPTAAAPVPPTIAQDKPQPLQMATQSTETPAQHPADQIAAAMADASTGDIAAMIDTIETMLGKANDLAEFRTMLASAWSDEPTRKLATILTAGLASAQAAGRSDLVDESQ
jgi:phage gp29-like protein